MKELRMTYQIHDGLLVPVSDAAVANLCKVLEKHEGETCDGIFTIIDSVELYQFKYLYEYCYKPMARASGMTVEEIDHTLKVKHLRRFCNSVQDIPHRLRGRCMVIMDGENVVGYIPSKAGLTHQEMKFYIEKVEEERDGLSGFEIPDWSVAMEFRSKAMGEVDA